MSTRTHRKLGDLIVNAPNGDEMDVAPLNQGRLLRIHVYNGDRNASIYLSPADEAALLAYLQERAGDRS